MEQLVERIKQIAPDADEKEIQTDIDQVRMSMPNIGDDEIFNKISSHISQQNTTTSATMPTQLEQNVSRETLPVEQTSPIAPKEQIQSSINPIITQYLLDKNEQKPVEDKYSPEAKKALYESINKPQVGDIIAQSVAGIGDALARSAGSQANNLQNVINLTKEKKAGQVEAFEKGAEAEKEKKLNDPASVDSKLRQLVFAKLTGVPESMVSQLSAKQIDELMPNAQKIYTTEEAERLKREMQGNAIGAQKDIAKMALEGKETAREEAKKDRELMLNMTQAQKEDQRAQDRLVKLGEALDPSKSVRSAFGISKIGFDRAERLQALTSAFPSGNLDRRQIEELAVGLNSLLGGSNSPAREQVRALVPKTALGDSLKLYEWLSSSQTGLKQQEFVKRLSDTVSREKETMENQLKRTRFQRIAPFSDLEKQSPDTFYDILRSNDVDPAEYQAWKKGGYKKINTIPTASKFPADAIKRKAPDGRIVVYDAKTKKQLGFL